MARIPYVNLATADQDVRAMAGRISRERGGEVPNLYNLLLHSPPVAEGWLGLGTALRQRSALDPRLRELVICAVASWSASGYEWAQHVGLAREQGVREAQLRELEYFFRSDEFDDLERVVLAVAAAVFNDRQVDEESMAVVAHRLGDRGVLEVVALAAYYTGLARFLRVLEVDIDDSLRSS